MVIKQYSSGSGSSVKKTKIVEKGSSVSGVGESIKKIKNVSMNNNSGKKKGNKKLDVKKFPTLKLRKERDIAMDFAEKVYEVFDKLVKSVILFGSSIKNTQVAGSDIDIIIIVDDAIVNFDDKLVNWYREELGKIIQNNPYKKDLHVNTVKLTTWWEDLYRGDPVVVNVIRYGESMIDFGGFFEPFKVLLQEGRIRTSREAIYTTLNRVPSHIVRSRVAELSAIEGCYWAMIESAQALLMSIKVLPPSPEHVADLLKTNFVDKKLLKIHHVHNLRGVIELHKKIVHGDVNNIDGKTIDEYQEKSEKFFKVILKLIKEIV
jgi:predicted nucleotidyltransferase